jgi:hypothetical protein
MRPHKKNHFIKLLFAKKHDEVSISHVRERVEAYPDRLWLWAAGALVLSFARTAGLRGSLNGDGIRKIIIAAVHVPVPYNDPVVDIIVFIRLSADPSCITLCHAFCASNEPTQRGKVTRLMNNSMPKIAAKSLVYFGVLFKNYKFLSRGTFRCGLMML